jgi:hypothetical protein
MMKEDLRDLVLSKFPRIDTTILDHLLVGIDRDSLDSIVVLGGSKDEKELARMNLIGSLRGLGFVVSGGRRGGDRYQVTDYAPMEPSPTIDTWDLPSQRLVKSIHRDPIDHNHYEAVKAYLKVFSEETLQEFCPLCFFAYDLGSSSTRGYWWDDSMAVIQRFDSRPIFKIKPFVFDAKRVILLSEVLCLVSCRPVQVVGLTKSMALSLKRISPKGTINVYNQAIYDVTRLASMSRDLYSKTDLERLRRSERDTPFFEAGPDSEATTYLIDTWKETVGHRQRQLSIGRDYVAAKIDLPKMMWVGVRNDLPVTLQIAAEFPFSKTTACHLVEKSLNYSWQLGGRSGTADWGVVRTCQLLLERGYTELNFGHIAGGTKGLENHKHRLLSRIVQSYSFNTNLKRQEGASK